MEKAKLNFRILILGVIMLILCFIFLAKLYDIQIVNAVNFSELSEKSITRSFTVPAARGSVFDRYGRPLITNSLSYTITLDEWRLKREEDITPTILKLIALCEAEGQVYTDTLPITYYPYRYEIMDETQKSRFDRFKEKMKWDDNIKAEDFITKLSEYFNIPGEISEKERRDVLGILYEVELRLKVPSVPPYTFAGDIDIDLVCRVREASLPGVDVKSEPVREYQTDYAAHILGRVGKIPEEWLEEYTEKGYSADEIIGVDGIERTLEEYLHGVSGVSVVETNSAGKIQNIINKTETDPGDNVFLTIDILLQEETERLLEENILRMQATGRPLKGKEAEAGAVVVIDVNTGEILAMASYPTFELKTFFEDYKTMLENPLTPMVNRAVAGVYSPGSTYKMATGIAALESDIITPSSRIMDRGAFTFYRDYQPKCHIYPGSHGSVNIVSALAKSCNYFFYSTGHQAGIEAQAYWAGQLGLGELTGIELTGEKTGYLAGPETSKELGQTWFPGMTLSAAIGQGDNAFTPIQLANYTATIANGGTVYSPHLLREVKSYDFTETLREPGAPVTRKLELKPDTMESIQKGMRAVAQPGGTAYSVFNSFSIPVAAKTGSVQTGNTPNNGVFVAYAPYDNPEIAVAVAIEKGGAGSLVAPVARDVFEVYFRLKDEMRVNQPENALQK